MTNTGTNFRTGASVSLIKGKTTTAATITSVSSRKIVCTLPTKGVSAGTWDIRIQNADGTSVVKNGAFTVKKGTPTDENVSSAETEV